MGRDRAEMGNPQAVTWNTPNRMPGVYLGGLLDQVPEAPQEQAGLLAIPLKGQELTPLA